MDQIDHPSLAVWEERQKWFEDQFDVEKRGGGYEVGEHATALLVDLQATYCAGAFVTVVMTSCAIVDAQLRETGEVEESVYGLKSAFQHSPYSVELEWLRTRRNRLVHFKQQAVPTITIEHHYSSRAEHEAEAKRAIRLVASIMFEHPWV